MKYIHISPSNNMVDEIISLPVTTDIQELYSETFLTECILVEDTIEVDRGMYYDDQSQTFEKREMPFFEEITPFSEHTKRITELEKENVRLKAQNELQAQQQAFLEDCILEMGNVVYA